MLGEKIFQLDLKISFKNGPRKLQVNKFQKVFFVGSIFSGPLFLPWLRNYLYFIKLSSEYNEATIS